MSIKTCIRNFVKAGRMTQAEGQALERRYDAILSRIRDASKAKATFLEEVGKEADERQRRALLTEATRKRLVEELMGENGQIDPRRFLYQHEHSGEGGGIMDAEHRRLAIVSDAHSRLDELLHEFRRGVIRGDARRSDRWWGSRKMQARMDNVVAELFGENTKDAKAKAMADSFAEVAEDLRVRFNDAGGAIGKLKKWGLPQWHDPLALMNVGRAKWIDYLMRDGVLDRERMTNQVTGRPLSDAELREGLEVSYDRIISEGWSDREPTGAPSGRGSLWSQHADSRFLHFKNAKAWRQYSKDFGNPDPYNAMMGHISYMARDIAHMETFGPNPNVGRNWIKQYLEKQAMTGRIDLNQARRAIEAADSAWDIMRGSINAPVNGVVANGLQTARNLATAAILGGAQLSAVSDVSFGAVRRGFIGMARTNSHLFRTLMQTIRHIGPNSRREAVRSGLILDNALHVLHAQSRYAGSLDTRSISGFLADRVISLQGLSAWTQAGKHAFAMDMMGMFADHVGKSWAELPGPVQRTLERAGFNGQYWQAISRAKLYEPRPGAVFLRPAEIAKEAGRDLAERYSAMLIRETRFAVPEATVRSTSILRSRSRPGTLAGELTRNFGQFKGFAVSVIMLHLGQIAREIGAGRRASGARYAGALLITSTVMGVLAMALKDLAAGRDPRKWTDEETYLDPEVWGAAILQAGGLGIYGDFLFSGTNRFGGGLAGTIAGPLGQTANDLRNLTIGNLQELLQGEETHFGRESARFVRRNVPGGSIWYLSLIYNRVLMDQLQYLADPDARASFHRQKQNRKRDYGQEYWWEPGETSPTRPPNLRPLVGAD